MSNDNKPSLQALIEAVQQLWYTFYPPLLALLLAVSAWGILEAPLQHSIGTTGLETVLTDNTLRQIEGLGLKPLLPVFALVVVLLLLQIVREVISTVGAHLPPYLILRPETMFQSFLSEDQLVRLWLNYDHAADLDSLDTTIDRELNEYALKNETDFIRRPNSWMTTARRLEWWLYFSKTFMFLLPLVALLSIVVWDRPWGEVVLRLLALELAIAGTSCLLGARLLHAIQQWTASRLMCWSSLHDQISKDSEAEVLASPRSSTLKALLQETAHGRWWALTRSHPFPRNRALNLRNERMRRADFENARSARIV